MDAHKAGVTKVQIENACLRREDCRGFMTISTVAAGFCATFLVLVINTRIFNLMNQIAMALFIIATFSYVVTANFFASLVGVPLQTLDDLLSFRDERNRSLTILDSTHILVFLGFAVFMLSFELYLLAFITLCLMGCGIYFLILDQLAMIKRKRKEKLEGPKPFQDRKLTT